MTQCINSICRW